VAPQLQPDQHNGAPASVIATGGTPQSATINTAFATQLQATVRDAGNNPLNGVTVTFNAPGSGASGTFAGGVNTAGNQLERRGHIRNFHGQYSGRRLHCDWNGVGRWNSGEFQSHEYSRGTGNHHRDRALHKARR